MSKAPYTLILLLLIVSGGSRTLVLVSTAAAMALVLFRLLGAPPKLRLSRLSTFRAATFAALAAVTILLLPHPNAEKFLITVFSALISQLVVSRAFRGEVRSQNGLLVSVIGAILVGDIAHLMGVFGHDMNLYKSFVEFSELSDLRREAEIGFLGMRYHGWFAEPSYHGAFSGILTALLWRNGARRCSLILGGWLFLLCPTPMMLLSALAVLHLSGHIHGGVKSQRRVKEAVLVALCGAAFIILFSSRFGTLLQDAMYVFSGAYVNTSESLRLLYPLLALFEHIETNGMVHRSLECANWLQCQSGAIKVPFITFFIFFGIIGLSALVALEWLISKTNLLRIIAVMTFASVLSGGSGYLPHFWMLTSLLLNASRQPKEMKTGGTTSGRRSLSSLGHAQVASATTNRNERPGVGSNWQCKVVK